MKMTTQYLFHVVGEDTAQLSRLHHSTIKRIKTFAIAIHIPVALWAITGYIVASRVFELDQDTSKLVSAFCACLIYFVERLVIAAPKVWFINIGRVLIGLVIAILGASTVDLVIFDREISQQLIASERSRVSQEFDRQIIDQANIVATLKQDWTRAQGAANCEANGTCGSGMRSLGPIYRELARQAEGFRRDYQAAVHSLETLKSDRASLVERDARHVISQAGLLARIEALHEYTMANKAALVAWLLFFILVFLFEMLVVISKLVFGETVDDRINAIREEINGHKALKFREAIVSPVAHANQLLDGVYGFQGKVT